MSPWKSSCSGFSLTVVLRAKGSILDTRHSLLCPRSQHGLLNKCHPCSSSLHHDTTTVWLTSPAQAPPTPPRSSLSPALSNIFPTKRLTIYRNWTRIVSLLPPINQRFAVPLKFPFKAGPWYFHPVLPNSPSLSEPHSACNLLGSSPSAFQTALPWPRPVYPLHSSS